MGGLRGQIEKFIGGYFVSLRMILQRARPPISYIRVCYANTPPPEGEGGGLLIVTQAPPKGPQGLSGLTQKSQFFNQCMPA